MRKKWICVALVFFIWLGGFAAQRISWSGTGEEIKLIYAAQNGCVELIAKSPNYTYVFSLQANLLKGSFSGTASGFVNNFAYLKGLHISFIDASGAYIQVASRAEAARIIEKLNTTGIAGNLKVHVIVKGDNVYLKIEKPAEELLPLPPIPVIRAYYLLDKKGNRIGGYFENIGLAPFEGIIEYKAGLSYACSWIAESVTDFAEGKSVLELKLNPGEKLRFQIIKNPAGGWTFIFPTLIYNDSPMTFSVFPPHSQSTSVQWFKEMIYKWWTGYHDPDPVDYINIKIWLRDLDGKRQDTLYFFVPIKPYFSPPR